jgi:tetratricopeptide (TPR) repeat protein
MKRFPLAAGALLLMAMVQAAPAQSPANNAPDSAAESAPDAGATPTALDAELFYQLLLGEINARGTEPAAGYSLILDAARRTNDPALFQRAVEVAFQSRSGDAALQAANAWKQAFPDSREANRFVLQILVALNRVADTAEPLKTELALAPPKERDSVLAALPRIYSRVTDKKLAANVVEQALGEYLAQPATGAAAWTTVGRMRMAAGDSSSAVDAARRAQAMNPGAEGPALLGLELMDSKLPQAEAIVRRYMEGKPLPEMRMGYARALLDAQRYADLIKRLNIRK